MEITYDHDTTSLQELIDKLDDVIILNELDGKISLVNQAYTRMLGYPTEDLLNKSPEKQEHFFTHKDKKKAIEVINRVLQGEEATQEVVYRHKDGRPIHTRLTGRPLELNGQAMALWTIVDLTELEESNKLNQTLMDNLPVAMWMADEVGRCCSVNKEFTRLLGWEKEELLGKLASESPYVCESGLPYMKEGTLEALNKLWEKVIQKKELGVEDTPFLTKDGKIVIHRGIEVPHGKGKGRIWMSTDITDLRKREEEIESTKDYMEHVLEGLVPPIWLLDKEGNVTHINSSFEQILGYKKEECVGNSLEEFCAKIVNEKDTPIIATRVKERLLSGEIARSVPSLLLRKKTKKFQCYIRQHP
jgi:PAS domain S-box-containing protein